jgi:hypothetical protein
MPEGRQPVVFRVARPAYLVVVFLAVGIWPIALYGGDDGSGYAGAARVTPLVLLFVVPILALVFIARTATIVDDGGITVRAAFGSRRLPWDTVRGLSVTGRNVYAVQADGSVRLPCVGVAQLAQVALASDGRLPEIAAPKPRYAPQRRRRR